MTLVGALDHIQTWYGVVAADLTRFPLPAFSHYTLARGAYEPSLVVLWLLDAETDSEGRICRSYAAQLRSLDDMRKFQCDAGMTSEAANAAALSQRLFAAARADGYVTVDAEGKERLKVGVRDMIALFNSYDQPHSTGGVLHGCTASCPGTHMGASGPCCMVQLNLTSRDSTPACPSFVWIGSC